MVDKVIHARMFITGNDFTGSSLLVEVTEKLADPRPYEKREINHSQSINLSSGRCLAIENIFANKIDQNLML